MKQENRRKALSPQQPLNGQWVLRISGSLQSKARKDLLRLATVDVATLTGRTMGVVDIFERRRVESDVYKS